MRRGRHRSASLLTVVGLMLCIGPTDIAVAETATVAVAANFAGPLHELVDTFESISGHDADIVPASTGQLYAQIVNGAPFDLLLAADDERPSLLVERGLAAPTSRATYAIGRLALWSADPDRLDGIDIESLADADFRWLAIANPDLAPYGAAAKQALISLGLWDPLQDRLVRGQSIAQTFAMTATGNADIGLVSLSQAIAYDGPAAYLIVDDSLHEPIRQDAVILERAMGNPAATAFYAFLQSSTAKEIIERYGYRVP